MDFYTEHLRSTMNGILDVISNKKKLEWWIKFRDPQDILKHHRSYLFAEVVFYFLGFLTFVHAVKNGGRYKWLWLAAIAHGLTVECVSYLLPDMDNFWHGQSMVMLIGQRLPLHIVVLYPVFIYTAAVAVSCMNLRWWAQAFAVGLSVVLIDVPFDIMGVKLLWWSWHDDDPNLADRHYWVPWNSYVFHAAFASSFAFLFFGLPAIFGRAGSKFQSSGFVREFVIVLITGMCSMPLGCLQFVPFYHFLHDSLKIHTEVCCLLYLGAFAFIIWSADRYPLDYARYKGNSVFNLVFILLVLHYAFYVFLVFTEKPEKIRSVGVHQSIGPCDEKVKVLTPFGHVLYKHRYLCKEKFDEDYFTLKCKELAAKPSKSWYTICGTPYENHYEYITIVCAFCAMGLFWFWQILCRSGPLSKVKSQRSSKQHRD